MNMQANQPLGSQMTDSFPYERFGLHRTVGWVHHGMYLHNIDAPLDSAPVRELTSMVRMLLHGHPARAHARAITSHCIQHNMRVNLATHDDEFAGHPGFVTIMFPSAQR